VISAAAPPAHAEPPRGPGQAETALRREGFRLIAGIDEAGRGPLAGPVVASCVLLDPDLPAPAGLDDSKRLSPAQRARLEREVRACALAFAVVTLGPRRIDQRNILQATLEAMGLALAALQRRPEIALIDGNRVCPGDVPRRALVKGDHLSWNIAAASILAKEERDRQMLRLDALYPGYGFAQHKGYPTQQHYAALHQLGPCPAHRRSFRLA